MSVLLIDAGNTRLKWALGATHGVLATADAARLKGALTETPAEAWISNVAGAEVQAAITRALAPRAVALHWVRAQAAQCGVRNAYDDPVQLGSDRWCGLIAARKRHAGALLVVNAGTTMTVDALCADGVFAGGVIVPGVNLMCDALARGTAQLRRQDGAFDPFPRNTANAIHSGALNACVGAIERMRGHMRNAGHGEPLLVLSGGASPALKPLLNGTTEVVDNLVLEGLLEISRAHAARA